MSKNNRGAVRLFTSPPFWNPLCFYAPVASLYRLEYGVSVFQITLIESVCFILSLLLEMPWGFVTARGGVQKDPAGGGRAGGAGVPLFWRAGALACF